VDGGAGLAGAGAGRSRLSTLRSDAQRNLERVLNAAAAAFAESGPDVSIDEIARRAGVGHATVFRRFPTKGSLIAAVVQERVHELTGLADAALAEDDAGQAFVDFVWRAAELHMAQRGLHACLVECDTPEGLVLEETAKRIVVRAQQAAAVRSDVQPGDVALLVRGALQAAPADNWRPFVQVVLDGLATRAAT
jgi:AcrR family transcriptional regulator